MHSALYAVRIVADPHIGILIHSSVCGIEDIIVIAYLCETLGTYTVGKIEGESAAVGKAVLYKLTFAVKSVPTGSVEELSCNIDIFIDSNLFVALNIVVLAVKLIETFSHLDSVNSKVELSVFVDYLLLTVFKIRNKHLAVLAEIMYSALYAVRIVADPHIGILIHSSVCGIEDIIVIAYLCETLGMGVIDKVVRFSVDIRKSVSDNNAVLIAPVFSVLELAASGCGGRINITARIDVDLTTGSSKDYSSVSLDKTVKNLSVLIAIIKLAVIIEKSVAKSGHKSGFLVEMIPSNILDIRRNGMSVSVSNIALDIEPVRTFFKSNKSAVNRLSCDIIFCSV